ncbi:Defective in cullin neddylation protein [Aphelenchoides bicaudatus]|nr:Defective in cullin neddylation protein [Aphelenchoides bicaudatus]
MSKRLSTLAKATKRLKLSSDEQQTPITTMSSKKSAAQKEKLRNFCLVTNCNEQIATTCMNQADWNLELAFDIFYSTPAFQESSNTTDCKKIDALFNKYANDPDDRNLIDTREPRIGPNGMQRLLNDLNIDPSSLNALVLAWKLRAKIQCEFSHDEFRNGLREMKVDSLDKLRNQVFQWPEELDNRDAFRSLYQFTFHYAKSAATRFLEVETAILYWTLLFQNKDERVPQWVEFLRREKQRGVSQDTWNLFLSFLISTDMDYSNFDFAGAYPTLIDGFVEYAKQQN